ncbi:MAG: hypothetical protein II980_04835, partial [Clostridia bacterium]|nr:hypothetical protein [Clostridia bacterium]
MRKARIVLGAIFLIVAIAWGACAAYGFMVSSTAVKTVEPIYTDSIEDPNAGVQNAVADNSTNIVALITKMGNFENTILTLFGFASAAFALTFLGLSIFNFAASGDGYVKKSEQIQQPQYPYANTGVYQVVPTGNTGVYPVVTANTGVYPVVTANTGVYPVVQPTVQAQEPVAEPVKEEKPVKESKKKKKAEPVKEEPTDDAAEEVAEEVAEEAAEEVAEEVAEEA